ncbi:MAG: SRPBCC family protein [Polyangiales bacterium]|nr:SRPBCC family protein [Myxococcales bacterium]
MKLDPKLDLSFERVVDVSTSLVWRAWTEPEHLMPWFTPAPWKTVECEIDLRPGGLFRTVMQSPEGENFPNIGCYLEIVPERRLVWTDTLEADFRPSRLEPGTHCPFKFTAILEFEPQGDRTRYRASVLHKDESSRKQHEELGFHEGWGTALDQLIAHMRTVGR